MEFNDFGFTAVTEDELDVVQKATASVDKAQKLYDAIQPLLNNLKLNEEKDYIFWPGRVAKIEQFNSHLKSILEENT
jgi:hypothetical protein